jgi:hypothetical protein
MAASSAAASVAPKRQRRSWMSSRLLKIAAVSVVAAALALGAAAWALAGGGGDGEGNASGPGADRARAAALAHLGGGKANAVERDSEQGATWEVEVTKSNGGTVDVHLDAAYKVVTVEDDSEQADTNDGKETQND